MYGFPWLLGSLLLLPYEFVPEDFDKCAGQLVPIGDGTLFKLLGTQFGGDGTTNFGLPDLTDKEPLKGLKYCIATKGAPPS
ncbi:MAG TPA: tail fiber protein [Candidatus Tumulicola sp.]|jgi:microcystin-dependent protein